MMAWLLETASSCAVSMDHFFAAGLRAEVGVFLDWVDREVDLVAMVFP